LIEADTVTTGSSSTPLALAWVPLSGVPLK
jgi:hypothetical protein